MCLGALTGFVLRIRYRFSSGRGRTSTREWILNTWVAGSLVGWGRYSGSHNAARLGIVVWTGNRRVVGMATECAKPNRRSKTNVVVVMWRRKSTKIAVVPGIDVLESVAGGLCGALMGHVLDLVETGVNVNLEIVTETHLN
jgi:hypothetical protein